VSGRRPVAALLVLAMASSACSLTLDLDECSDDAACGPGLVCRDQLCVDAPQLPLDARCTVIGDSASQDALVFGAVLPVTDPDGSAHEWGPFWQAAVELAVKELNLRFGAAGRPLRVIACDTSGNRDAAIALATDLVARGVPAIISDGSQETIAASQVTIPAGVLLMSGAATAPEIADLPDAAPGGGAGLVWRTTPSDVLQAQVIASELTPPAPPAPRVAVLARDDAYGQGLSVAFAKAYSGPNEAFAFPADDEVGMALSAAAGYGPDVALVIGFPDDVVRVVNGAGGTAGLGGVEWFFTQGAKFPDLFDRLEDPTAIEGARGTSPATAAFGSDAYLWFAAQYAAAEQVDPSTVVDVTNMFDAAMLLALAAEWSLASEQEITGAGLARGLTHMSGGDGALVVPLDPPNFNKAAAELRAGRDIDVEGASGHLDFDPASGEAPADIEVWTVQGGKFETEKVVTPD
jgi:branched-chain amino acid transport system substrate-binding protein